jgi:hypothetical protein
MSDQANQLINQNDPRFSLVEQGKKRDTLARQIRLMITNGKQLSDSEAMALAQYAVATDLNPFSGECYYIPSVGPTPGVAGWRKKGQEQLEFEAAKANEPGCHFWMEEVDLSPDEKAMLKDGDVGCAVVLRDSVTNHRWRMAYLEMAKELTALGDKDALENAKLYAREPTWTGFGIVDGRESFAYDGKPEKMTRKERALKRAEKIAIRKRFPRINLPEIINNIPEPEDMIEGFASDVEPTPVEILNKLGYEPDGQSSAPPKPVEVNQDNPLIDPPEPEEVLEVVEDPDYPQAPPDQPSLLDAAIAAGGVPKEKLAGKLRSWSPEAVNVAVEYAYSKDPKGKTIEAVNILNYSSIDPKAANAGLVKSWCEYYRQCRDGGMTPQESAAAADEEILAK